METFSDLPPCWVIVESWLPDTLLRGTWSRNRPASEGQSLSSCSSSSPTLCPEQAADSPDCSSCNIGCLQDRGEGHNLSPVICTDQKPILMNSYDLCFSVRGIKCISGIPKRNCGKCHQKHMLSLKPMPAARKKNWDMGCLLLGESTVMVLKFKFCPILSRHLNSDLWLCSILHFTMCLIFLMKDSSGLQTGQSSTYTLLLKSTLMIVSSFTC